MHGGGALHLCPKCMIEADWIGASNLIEPFWNRLPRFFAYPFALQPLLLILVLTVLSTLLSGPGLIRGLIGLILWGVLLTYSYAALKSTARGDLIPPKIDGATLSEDFYQVFKQLGLYFLIGFGFTLLTTGFGVIEVKCHTIGAI